MEGVALSFVCQVATFFALILVAGVFHASWLAFAWSVPQWGVVVPLFLRLKRRNSERSAAALLATSVAGMVLNAGLVWLVVDSINHLNY